MKGQTAAIAGAAAVVLLLAACGGGNGEEGRTEAEIRQSMEGYLNAAQGGRFSDAYDYLEDDCKQQVSLAQFEALLTQAFSTAGDERLRLEDVRILESTDDTALVELVMVSEGPNGVTDATDQAPTELVREDGEWRIAGCEGFVEASEFKEAEEPPEPAPTPGSR